MAREVMIVTGEASGDLHASHLVKSLQRRDPDLHVFGMGGPELARAGMEILFDGSRVSVVGVTEVFTHLPDIFRAQRCLRRALKTRKPHALVIIDLPDFNIPLATAAKKSGIPVFYYIPPQLWAWRTGRVRKLRKVIDRLGVILPFEESFYARHSLQATYVGHPLLDAVKTTVGDKAFRKAFEIGEDTVCVGLLPGSRRKEISSLLPAFLESGVELKRRLEQKGKKVVFLIPKAESLRQEDLEKAGLSEFRQKLDIQVHTEQRWDLMACCDCAVAASGTVTLELAMLDVPMVVCYKLSAVTYRLARFLVHLEHFSLVNLIAGHEVVPELVQEQVNGKEISERLLPMTDEAHPDRERVCMGLAQVRSTMGEGGASERAAAIVLELLGKHGGRP